MLGSARIKEENKNKLSALSNKTKTTNTPNSKEGKEYEEAEKILGSTSVSANDAKKFFESTSNSQKKDSLIRLYINNDQTNFYDATMLLPSQIYEFNSLGQKFIKLAEKKKPKDEEVQEALSSLKNKKFITDEEEKEISKVYECMQNPELQRPESLKFFPPSFEIPVIESSKKEKSPRKPIKPTKPLTYSLSFVQKEGNDENFTISDVSKKPEEEGPEITNVTIENSSKQEEMEKSDSEGESPFIAKVSEAKQEIQTPENSAENEEEFSPITFPLLYGGNSSGEEEGEEFIIEGVNETKKEEEEELEITQVDTKSDSEKEESPIIARVSEVESKEKEEFIIQDVSETEEKEKKPSTFVKATSVKSLHNDIAKQPSAITLGGLRSSSIGNKGLSK